MTEKLMVYVFIRSKLAINPADPTAGQHLTHAHYFPVPAEEADEHEFVLLDRYGFETVPSEVKEELEAQGFDRELSWDVVEVISPTAEEWQAARAKVLEAAMKISYCGPLCAPSDLDALRSDDAISDRMASCIISGVCPDGDSAL